MWVIDFIVVLGTFLSYLFNVVDLTCKLYIILNIHVLATEYDCVYVHCIDGSRD